MPINGEWVSAVYAHPAPPKKTRLAGYQCVSDTFEIGEKMAYNTHALPPSSIQRPVSSKPLPRTFYLHQSVLSLLPSLSLPLACTCCDKIALARRTLNDQRADVPIHSRYPNGLPFRPRCQPPTLQLGVTDLPSSISRRKPAS